MKKNLYNKLSFILKTRNLFGQSILDFVLAFIAIAFLSVGIVRIWVWFSANFARRQVNYQQSRFVAGIPKTYDKLGRGKNVDIAAKEDNLLAVYRPLDLTEDWVFKGKPHETIFGEGIDGIVAPRKICKAECGGDTACTITIETDGVSESQFNENCVCFTKCMCDFRVKIMSDLWNGQAAQLKEDAESLRQRAKDLRAMAKKVCGRWCFSRKRKKARRKLRAAATKLDQDAVKSDKQAIDLENKAAAIKNCCGYDYPIKTQQDDCISLIKGVACAEVTQPYSEKWQEEIARLTEDKQELQDAINVIGVGKETGLIVPCNKEAKTSCEASCTKQCTFYENCDVDGNNCSSRFDKDCYDQCYPPCYETTRNTCCQGKVVKEDPSGRNCDTPVPPCEEETEEGDNKCSLALLSEACNDGITQIDELIRVLNEKIKSLPACCVSESIQDQLGCISRETGGITEQEGEQEQDHAQELEEEIEKGIEELKKKL